MASDCPMPVACGNQEELVCASNGKTFRNRCILESWSCHNNELINVVHMGPCSRTKRAISERKFRWIKFSVVPMFFVLTCVCTSRMSDVFEGLQSGLRERRSGIQQSLYVAVHGLHRASSHQFRFLGGVLNFMETSRWTSWNPDLFLNYASMSFLCSTDIVGVVVVFAFSWELYDQ